MFGTPQFSSLTHIISYVFTFFQVMVCLWDSKSEKVNESFWLWTKEGAFDLIS